MVGSIRAIPKLRLKRRRAKSKEQGEDPRPKTQDTRQEKGPSSPKSRVLSLESSKLYALCSILYATLLLVVGCGSAPMQSTQQQPELGQSASDTIVQFRSEPGRAESYPAWFWNMPSSENSLFAVGLSKTFAHAETSEENAIEDAAANLTRALSVRIKGEYGIVYERGRPVFSGNNMEEEVSPKIYAFVEENYQVAAKYVSPTHTFVLLRLGEDGAAMSISSAASIALPKEPDWVTSPPKQPGYLYASGHSNPYYYETSSWSLAEQHARITLALIVESKVRGVVYGITGEGQTATSSSTITVGTDIQLSRFQVVARWKHPEYNTCVVLVRMPLSANTESITSLAKSILAEKSQEEPSRKSQAEIIQEAFDELDRLTNSE